ncbi:MAG: uroporphyrinogen decarboxylase [Weeksellaceae bacterium]|jgi:uncharacterized protein with PQ loop repeat|nr:uroporphyrinogen decarboxylase [Weeksellaceae bacterium]
MNTAVFEWIGYSASLFVVLSFVVNQLRQVRIINMIGCVCFVIYGIYFEAWPVVIPNALVTFIQLYFLLFKDKQQANG